MSGKLSKPFVQSLIRQHTKLCRKHLTPELQLHLITPECPLWLGNPRDCPFDDPFWAFYWPGGQALTRYILDNPSLFKSKSVLDIGSGCGSAALAAKLIGADTVLANDIDPVALTAIDMNKKVNSLEIHLDGQNLLLNPLTFAFHFILFGDMFYDPEFADVISKWLKKVPVETTVLIGDPGRLSFVNHPLRKSVELFKEYQLPASCRSENNGFSFGAVWKLTKEQR